MAQHISSFANSGIPVVNKGEFYKQVQPGDLLFCWGLKLIDKIIGDLTNHGPSHVLMCWTADFATMWLTLEATFVKGVQTGLLSDYVDGYSGVLILARRPVLTLKDVYSELNRGFSLLDDGYDSIQEVSIAAKKLIKALPLLQPKGDLYCSGLQYEISLATKYPLQKPLASYPTPEDNWTDSTVVPVCMLASDIVARKTSLKGGD